MNIFSRLALFFLLVLPLRAEDLPTIRLDLARLQAERVEAYLAAMPEPPDQLEAVNLLLESYQALGNYQKMCTYLEQRYALLLPGDSKALKPEALNQLVNRTALPLIEYNYRLFRYDKAEETIPKGTTRFCRLPLVEPTEPGI